MTAIPSTDENLRIVAAPLIAQWLIEAALVHSFLTYGEAKARLEEEHGFASIGRATRLGIAAGYLMDRIHEVDEDAPLLNALLVRQREKTPGDGAGGYYAEHFDVPELGRKGARQRKPALWREYSTRAATEVYEFTDWPKVYEKTFHARYRPSKDRFSARNPNSGTERDGIRRGRAGEGPRHKALRFWVRDNPAKLFPRVNLLSSDTECDIDSGDRIDVVFRTSSKTIVIEVKSRDSNESDLKRGVFQCVKYRAVAGAMDVRPDPKIEAVLVTEVPLPGYLADIARRLRIRHIIVPKVRN